MEKIENREDKKQITENFFKWLFDRETIELEGEVDLSLAPLYYDPNIYYTRELAEFFNTKAMQRLGRVKQLGLQIAKNPNSYHNRLDHSKGTYNRKLEEMIYLTFDEKYKK